MRSSFGRSAFLTIKDDYPALLKGAPKSKFDVVVYGGDLELSQRRAEAVRAYLISRGVEADRLKAAGEMDVRDWIDIQLRVL